MLKSSYALGEARATENVTIDNCMVSGYDLGTLYDGTFKTAEPYGRTGPPHRGRPDQQHPAQPGQRPHIGRRQPGSARERRRLPRDHHVRPLPAYGFFIRHARGITLDNVEVRFEEPDTRPAYALRDVADADFHHNRADKVHGTPTFVLDDVDDFTVTTSRPVPDTRVDHPGCTCARQRRTTAAGEVPPPTYQGARALDLPKPMGRQRPP